MERDIASLHSWLQSRLAEMNRVSPPSVCFSLMLVNRSIETAHRSSLSMRKNGHRERRRLRAGRGGGPQGCVPFHGAPEMRKVARGKSRLAMNTVHRKEHLRAQRCKEWPLGHVSNGAQWTWSQNSGFPCSPLPPPSAPSWKAP